MAEFEGQLERILNDPAAMDQIFRLAQSLSSPSGGPAPASPQSPSASAPLSGASAAPDSGPSPPGGGAPYGDGTGPSTGNQPPPGGGGPAVSSSPLLRRLLPLLMEGQRGGEARTLLYALRPYLKPRRQEKIERALQLARLYRVGRQLLGEGRG